MDRQEVQKAIKRHQLEESLKQDCLASIDDRVSRYLELNFGQVVPNTHFAPITIECILLYRDGYYFACIALCQAVAEALLRFMCERNDIRNKGFETNIRNLSKLKDSIHPDWIKILKRVWKNRNDYHHLNPNVPTQKEKLF